MKGIQGLILALGLGVAGALFNFAYLNNKASEVEVRSVVGVVKDIERGEIITKAHVEPVNVPKNVFERLKQYAVPYESVGSIIDMPASRNIRAGDLVLKEDTTSAAWQMNFGQTGDGDLLERGMPIPVDGRSFVPSNYKPGDLVEFMVSRFRLNTPTPAHPAAAKPAAEAAGEGSKAEGSKPATIKPVAEVPVVPPPDPNATIVLGPFRVLAIGNRLGEVEIMKTSKIPQLMENVVTIKVTRSKSTGELDPEAQKLWNLLQATNFQQVGILMVPRTNK